MSLHGILNYVARAARFSFVVCGVYAALRLLWLKIGKRRLDPKRELIRLLFTAYFAALCEIIALRGGSGGVRSIQPIPLLTTLGELSNGAWPFVYHVIGNAIWFVPLGMFLKKRTILQSILLGAAVSTGLEILQFILSTGVTDIDDVILNTLGTLTGYLLTKIPLRIPHKKHRP